MDDQAHSPVLVFWKLLFWLIAAYLFFFLLIILDELILETNWIFEALNGNQQYEEILRTIYFPLIYLVRHVL